MLSPGTKAPRALVVGSINSDLILRTPRLPKAGESLIGTEYRSVAGGKGANQAVAIARLGCAATLVGRTGVDPAGETLIAQLRADRVRTEFVERSTSTPTGLAVVTIDDAGENSIITIAGANAEVCEQDVEAALMHDSYDVLLLQLEIPATTVIATCRLAVNRNIPVVLDAGPAQQFPLERLPPICVLTPNETETYALTGIDPDSDAAARTAAKALLERCDATAVVLKLGHRGAVLHRRNGTYEHLAGHRIPVIDTTAAGDAFTAAMAIGLIQSGNLREAVVRGNAAGALAVTKVGAQPSLPSLDSLEAFLSDPRLCGAQAS